MQGTTQPPTSYTVWNSSTENGIVIVKSESTSASGLASTVSTTRITTPAVINNTTQGSVSSNAQITYNVTTPIAGKAEQGITTPEPIYPTNGSSTPVPVRKDMYTNAANAVSTPTVAVSEDGNDKTGWLSNLDIHTLLDMAGFIPGVGDVADAQYFQLDNWEELSSTYSNDEIWKINEKFLDIQTSSGREIYLSHNPGDYILKDDFYSKELNYLLEDGYTFMKEGDVWHAIR